MVRDTCNDSVQIADCTVKIVLELIQAGSHDLNFGRRSGHLPP